MPRPMAFSGDLRHRLNSLYFGDSQKARRFRYGLVIFDIFTVALFLLMALIPQQWWFIPVDLAFAIALTAEFAARLYADCNPRRQLLSFATLSDLVVILSLLLPAIIANLAFLRVLRTVRLLRSYRVLRDLRSDSQWFRVHEDVVQRTANLVVFIFLVTCAVFVTQNDINPQIRTYIDALYFTVTTLTTTGFGDVTLIGPGGRLLAIVIMVAGVSLFLRLLQALFRPFKIQFKCPDCGLLLHDADAVHCKHCGRVLPIEDEGLT